MRDHVFFKHGKIYLLLSLFQKRTATDEADFGFSTLSIYNSTTTAVACPQYHRVYTYRDMTLTQRPGVISTESCVKFYRCIG